MAASAVGFRNVTVAQMLAGPGPGTGPAPGRWTVTKAKSQGVTPGFEIKDSQGDHYIIKLDPPGESGLATGPDVIGSRLLWAAGYNVPDNAIAHFRLEDLDISPKANWEDWRGKKHPDHAAIHGGDPRHTDRESDGRIRCVASRYLAGKPLGPFKYTGRRPDDPEDRIPHELRRELRGMWTIAAWVNHADSRGPNSLDMWVTEGGRSFVRHYLIDFGSILGSSATTIERDYSTGSEYYVDFGAMARNVFTAGLAKPTWEDVQDPHIPSVGFVESKNFDPKRWKPDMPNPAFDERTDRDAGLGRAHRGRLHRRSHPRRGGDGAVPRPPRQGIHHAGPHGAPRQDRGPLARASRRTAGAECAMSTRGGIPVRRCWRSIVEGLVLVLFAMPGGCAGHGRLAPVATTVAPVPRDTTVRDVTGRLHVAQTWRPMFGDTLIGLVPGTGDSTRRYLGRLRDGYAADTINVMLFGDNRPGWRSARLQTEYAAVHKMFVSPRDFFNGLVAHPGGARQGPVAGSRPDPRHPGQGHQHAPLGTREAGDERDARQDRFAHRQGQIVSAVVNSGDLVDDGRTPPTGSASSASTSRSSTGCPTSPSPATTSAPTPRTASQNWRAATGLPVGTDRLYYCFDSADGWLRFIAIDTNPIVDPGTHWSRDVQVKYSDEEFKLAGGSGQGAPRPGDRDDAPSAVLGRLSTATSGSTIRCCANAGRAWCGRSTRTGSR